MCECLDRIREKLTNRHGPNSQVELELKATIDVTDLDSQNIKMGMSLPPLYYSYKPEKGKRKKSYVVFNYCPFCGKKET